MSKIKIVIGYLIGRFFFDFKGKHTFLKILNDPHKYKNIFKEINLKFCIMDLSIREFLVTSLTGVFFFKKGLRKD